MRLINIFVRKGLIKRYNCNIKIIRKLKYQFMETMDWIALGALVIAIASWLFQILSSRKANVAMKKANEIQSEIYSLSKKIDEFENRKGEVLLLNIIGRYFVIHFNYFQIHGKVNSIVEKKKYLSELTQLSNDFNELTNNHYYIKFIEIHPDINLLILSLRGAIIEQETIKGTMINPQTFTFFYDMYQVLKTEIQNKQILSHKFFVTVDEAAVFLKGIVDDKKNKHCPNRVARPLT